MATFAELLQAQEDLVVKQRTLMAVVLVAEAVRTESEATPNHANRLKWARDVFSNPRAMTEPVIWAVLAQNAALPLSTILNATDQQTQTAVAATVDVFAQG